MRRRLWGVALMFVVGEVFGILLGNVFFNLFEKTVPPAVLTSFNHGTAHAAFLLYGAGAGLFIFAWTLIVSSATRVFGPRPRAAASKEAAVR